MKGLGGAVESPEVSWRCWPAAMVVEVEPLRFLDDYAIWCVFFADFDRWDL